MDIIGFRFGGLGLALCFAVASCTDDTTDTSASGEKPGAPSSPTPASEPRWVVLVRGTLNAKDPAEQKTQHDALARGGEESAKKAGDVAHDVFVGADILGSAADTFVALDRWTDASKIQGFYSEPAFAEGFAKLITPKNAPEVFEKSDRFHTWGSLDAADSVSPRYWVFVRARLKESDPAKQKEGHDAAAKGGEENVKALGDVAHVVFTSTSDPRELLAIDVWTKPDGIVAIYTNPDFQKALAPVFEGQPSLTVGRSTDWHQW
jgi:quinol monooxygenase YgiN